MAWVYPVIHSHSLTLKPFQPEALWTSAFFREFFKLCTPIHRITSGWIVEKFDIYNMLCTIAVEGTRYGPRPREPDTEENVWSTGPTNRSPSDARVFLE